VVLDLRVYPGDLDLLAQCPDEMIVIVANGTLAENAKGSIVPKVMTSHPPCR
jgi:hypothetical protein